MNTQRRRFLQSCAAGSLGFLAGCNREESPIDRGRASPYRGGPPSVLVLGGTGFVGPPLVRRARERGFAVTLFNRGRTNAGLFPDLELIVGDRNDDLGALRAAVGEGRSWNAVVDLSGYAAEQVAATTRILGAAVDQYVFISTVAVYARFDQPNDEDSPVLTSRSGGYGPQKAEAERIAAATMPGRTSILRPTYVAGPGDDTDRFTYWPVLVARGGEILVPGPPERPVQFIDVRDLAEFAIGCIENHVIGTYNTVIPAASYTMHDLIQDCRAATGANVEPVWVTPEFVRRHGADRDNGLPIWESPLGERAAFPLISGARAASRGFSTRPPAVTIRDTLDWWNSLPAQRRDGLRAGLAAGRERELLLEWRKASG